MPLALVAGQDRCHEVLQWRQCVSEILPDRLSFAKSCVHYLKLFVDSCASLLKMLLPHSSHPHLHHLSQSFCALMKYLNLFPFLKPHHLRLEHLHLGQEDCLQVIGASSLGLTLHHIH